jgi:hypothetical protein
MTAVFTVDQAATFKSVFFLSCEPKTEFGKNDVQSTTADGTPQWIVQVAAGFEQFGKTTNEVLKITMNNFKDPSEAFGGMPQPVQFGGFRVGVMPVKEEVGRDGKPRVTGGQAFYQADVIRPLSHVASTSAKPAKEM